MKPGAAMVWAGSRWTDGARRDQKKPVAGPTEIVPAVARPARKLHTLVGRAMATRKALDSAEDLQQMWATARRALGQRKCWVCGVSGFCLHRELEVDMAIAEAHARAIGRSIWNSDAIEETRGRENRWGK